MKNSLRHFIKRIPFSDQMYDILTTVFTPLYSQDGMRLYKTAPFLSDSAFIRSFDKAQIQEKNPHIKWRSHVVQWAGFHCTHLSGDFVECGVNKAFLSRSVMEYIDFDSTTKKKFFLFDTYNGLVEDLVRNDEKAAFKNEYRDCYDFVVQSFKHNPNVVVVRGVVPESLTTVQIDRVAYLSIDMNCAEPERAALEFFWPRMVSGGIIVLDDYAFPGREPQQVSADEFAESVGVKILSIPTGQGLIIKP